MKKIKNLLSVHGLLFIVLCFLLSTVLLSTAYSAPSIIATIAAGGEHSLALKSDGTVWAWGQNGNGQLGDGTNTRSNIPVQVSGLTGVIAIAGGGFHSLALKSDGTVWAWGENDYGQLGDGTNNNSNTPVQVSNLTDVIAIAGGWSHSLTLKSDGTVWAWGENDYGQLGDGTNSDRNTPVQVQGLGGIVAIAGGGLHSLALKSDGTVWDWGSNSWGQLGNGTNTYSNTPVQVSNLTDVIAIAGGDNHSLALKSDGTVWAWGMNSYGQLGDGTSNNSSNTPVQVSGLTGVIAIAGGKYHSLAIKSDGTVWAWGENGYGQLGDGTSNNSSNTPVQVSNLTDVIAIAGGGYHSLALKSDGTVWAWGANWNGQLGDGTLTDRLTPVQVNFGDITPPSAIINLSAGSPTVNSIRLTWIATGDDANVGIATTYDIRYSTSTIDETNWDLATQVTGEPTPKVAGSSETFTVAGLNSNTTYYFAIKVADEVPNWTGLSNIASAKTSLPLDTTSPSAIIDLQASSPTTNSITLTWTSPGDDGNVGTANQYDVRYSTATITDTNWSTATQCTGEPAPNVAGSPETFIVTGLNPGTTYYFAIKTADEVPNLSALSNVPSGTTLPPAPPQEITEAHFYNVTRPGATDIAIGEQYKVTAVATPGLTELAGAIANADYVPEESCVIGFFHLSEVSPGNYEYVATLTTVTDAAGREAVRLASAAFIGEGYGLKIAPERLTVKVVPPQEITEAHFYNATRPDATDIAIGEQYKIVAKGTPNQTNVLGVVANADRVPPQPGENPMIGTPFILSETSPGSGIYESTQTLTSVLDVDGFTATKLLAAVSNTNFTTSPVVTPEILTVTTVLPPAEALKIEIQKMEDLKEEISASGIVIAQGLTAKLDASIGSINRAILDIAEGRYSQAPNMINGAQNQLGAFVNMLSAQSGKKVSQELAQKWIAEAEEIIAGLEKIKAQLGVSSPASKEKVSAKADLNADGKINEADLEVLKKAFNSKPGDANWSPGCDLNGDGKIDLGDFGVLVKEYNK